MARGSRRTGTFSHAGFNSPLHETTADADRWECLFISKICGVLASKNFPKDKILIGIPCFGHGFATSGWGQTPLRPEARIPTSRSTTSRPFFRPVGTGIGQRTQVFRGCGTQMPANSFPMMMSSPLRSKAAWANQAGMQGILLLGNHAGSGASVSRCSPAQCSCRSRPASLASRQTIYGNRCLPGRGFSARHLATQAAHGRIVTIQSTPNRSVTIPKHGDQNVLPSGISTFPPSLNAAKRALGRSFFGQRER